jgi:hypothetical protein
MRSVWRMAATCRAPTPPSLRCSHERRGHRFLPWHAVLHRAGHVHQARHRPDSRQRHERQTPTHASALRGPRQRASYQLPLWLRHTVGRFKSHPCRRVLQDPWDAVFRRFCTHQPRFGMASTPGRRRKQLEHRFRHPERQSHQRTEPRRLAPNAAFHENVQGRGLYGQGPEIGP